IPFQEFPQIPSAGQRVGGWIEQLFRRETGYLFRAGPFACGLRADLHQAKFAFASPDRRIEPAFPPDNRFDERRHNAVTLGCYNNDSVETMVPPTAITPHSDRA